MFYYFILDFHLIVVAIIHTGRSKRHVAAQFPRANIFKTKMCSVLQYERIPNIPNIVLGRSLVAKVTDRNPVKLQCRDAEFFRIIQRHLRQTKTEFLALPFAEECLFKVVIKGLLPDITETELTNEHESKEYEIHHIKQFGNFLKKFPIYLVQLPENSSPSQQIHIQQTLILLYAH